MVTAGVYLIARTYGLFLLAPDTLEVVAWVGLLTLLIAASTALVQNDIKRILAYSTISQIGYMFLALGVMAFSSAIFHLMTHAFFKALLFLAAGTVIHCLHHEHNIFKMGGLRTRLPVVFWSFLIGSAALAALPFTSGFYSKDAILLSAWEVPEIGPWLWAGGLLGALLTSIYSFRLVFIVFFGEAKTEPNKQPGWKIAVPLSLLCVLSIIGGWFVLPLTNVFPASEPYAVNHTVEIISIATPLIGLTLAYFMFLSKQLSVSAVTESTVGKFLQKFWFNGWHFDALYQIVLVSPYRTISNWWRNEPIDLMYNGIVQFNRWCHRLLSQLQSGKLRWYATSMVFGIVILVLIMLRSLA
jgi:NADH-quinone oxidoreductase subunit L